MRSFSSEVTLKNNAEGIKDKLFENVLENASPMVTPLARRQALVKIYPSKSLGLRRQGWGFIPEKSVTGSVNKA